MKMDDLRSIILRNTLNSISSCDTGPFVCQNNNTHIRLRAVIFVALKVTVPSMRIGVLPKHI